ncbi:Hint domain-containing protein [Methylobacterium nodulans]|uniref:Hint domain-containing protein n=1 Tax=Methylobacterium nodulans TaxID=114616 RepID=UPI001FCC2C17
MSVEDLAIGDVVVTVSGEHRPIRWIGHRAYTGRFANANPDVLPICFKAGSLADGTPARDLWVSPKHAMFLDGCLIPAVHLVNGVTITTAERVDSVEYWHVELDRHDVLLAEGAPSESFVDDHSRGMFHNAHTFAQLYPDTPPQEAIYCAPRVESGYVLEAARRRLAERAGLPVPAARVFGPLRGSIDRCDTDAQGGVTVVGWAQDLAHPDGPVCLDVVIDGTVVAQAFAERYRADLEGIGIGDGRHAFSLTLPEALTQHGPHTIEVRRSADGAPIAAALQVAAPERHAA